jgi:hypothetical protein
MGIAVVTDERITEDIREFKQQYVEFVNEYLDVPKPIEEAYDLVSLLSESKRSYVFIIADRKTEIRYILKVFDAGQGTLWEPIFKHLNHPGIPGYIAMYLSGGKAYLIREYFEGVTLADYLRSRGPMPAVDMCAIALQLCGVLAYLHSRPKPVIHRDIKAENIIITEDQAVKLIDFDIAREYDETAGSDTVYYGTKAYSPPEQFGYAQTDARTDIYALGVLMLFMLTGSKEREQLAQIEDIRYQRIIRKCLSFAPNDRYASVTALQKALEKAEHASGRVRVRTAVMLAGAALLLGVLIGLWIPWPGAGISVVQPVKEQVVFQSALIEDAVRLQLDKTENVPVYPDELAGVTSLHICGDQVFDGAQRLLLEYMPQQTELHLFLDSYKGESVAVHKGDIQTLEDLAAMPNLRILDVMFEEISDLSPLEGLPIERLQLAGNNITDLAPLTLLPLLTYLNLDGNPVMDLAPLSQITRLEVLDASYTYIYDLSPLQNLQALDSLYINNAKLTDVSPLAEMNLSKCFVKNNQITDFSPLDNVEELYTDGNPDV